MKQANVYSLKMTKREKMSECVQKHGDKELFFCENLKNSNINIGNKLSNHKTSSKDIVDEIIGTNKQYTVWIEVKKKANNKQSNRNGRSPSENSSRDCGYSSEHNVSSSSLPSTPEGSEVACCDNCCEDNCQNFRNAKQITNFNSSFCVLKEHGGALTLSQMLQVKYYYISYQINF